MAGYYDGLRIVDRLSLPLLKGPPLMDPLDVTHGVLRCWRGGVWGGEEVCVERWRLLLADGCTDAGKPLPDCLGDWTGEHDMAECDQLARASRVGAGM